MSVNSRYNSRSCNYEGSKPYNQSNLNNVLKTTRLSKTFAKLMPDLSVLVQASVYTYFKSYSKEQQDLAHFITSLYDQTSTQALTAKLFGEKTPTETINIINKHIDVFKIPEGGKKTKRLGPREIANTFDLTLGGKSKENTSDFAYLMMLDMQHDETIPNDMSFEEFCRERITIKGVSRRSPVSYFFGRSIEPIQTDFRRQMGGITKGKGGKGSEKNIKESFEMLHRKGSDERTLMNSKNPNFLQPKTLLYLLLDQEDESATGTRVIEAQNRVVSTVLKSNGTLKKKVASSISPLFTVPNLTDPGASMLILGAKKVSHKLMMKNNNDPRTGGLLFNTSKPTFIIKHAYGTTKLEYYYSTNLREEFNNARNISGNGTVTKVEKRQFGYGILISNTEQKKKYNTKNEPSCKIRIPAGITKNMAKDDTRSTIKLGKFFGDFMQGLTALSINDTESPGGIKRKFALTTGDAMLGNMYLFMGRVTNKKTRMMFIMSKETNLKLFGFDDVITPMSNNVTQTAANSENVGGSNYNSNGTSQQSKSPQKQGIKRNRNKNSAKNSNSNAINLTKNSNSNAVNVTKKRKIIKNSAKESSNNGGVKPMNVNKTRKPTTDNPFTAAILLAQKRKKTQEQIAKERRDRNLNRGKKAFEAEMNAYIAAPKKNTIQRQAATFLAEKRKLAEQQRRMNAIRAQKTNKSPPKPTRSNLIEEMVRNQKIRKQAKAKTAKLTRNNRVKSAVGWRKASYASNKLLENKYKSMPDARRKASKQLRKISAVTPMKTKGATPFRGSNGQYLNKYNPKTAKTHKQLVALMARAENKAVNKGASRQKIESVRNANSSSNSKSNSNSNFNSNSNSNNNRR